MSSTGENKNIEWKEEEENILKEWSDKSICYRWLHTQAHIKYRKLHAAFTIPVIILSTITGTANFAQDRYPAEFANFIVMGIGGLNITAGIISTIAQFLKIAELNEGHRVAAISWGKFSRKLKIELARNPDDRSNCYDFMKTAKEEYDRLLETSPSISNDIILRFKNTFKHVEGLIIPEICDVIEPTSIFPRIATLFNNEIDDQLKELKNEINVIKSYDLEDPDEHLDRKLVDKIRKDFKQSHGRYPTEAEFMKEYEKQSKD